jgi:hypothetical protein
MIQPSALIRFVTAAAVTLLARPLGAQAPEPAQARYGPYKEPGLRVIYNQLFGDDLELYRDYGARRPAADAWKSVLASNTESATLRRIADDRSVETRLRLLAYSVLRAREEPVPAFLLGVVFEFRVDGGLDALAAYADGTVRYLNHSGAGEIYEADANTAEIADEVDRLLSISEDPANEIPYSYKERLAPPSGPLVRITFLTSAGPYVSEGAMEELLERDTISPAVNAAIDLLEVVVETSLRQRKQTKAR